MSKMKKIISMVLVIALTATVAVGGTLAYLADDDAQVNTFTTGNVYIDLWEDFGDNTGIEKLLPATGSAQDGTLKNGVEKEVYVTNTGSENAYVRVHIAIPAILDDVDSAGNNTLHFNFASESVGAGLWDWSKTTGADYTGDWNYYTTSIDDIAYNVYVVTYGSELAPGASTIDAIHQVYLDSSVTNEDIETIKETLGDEWKIYVAAEGCQADGFEDAYEALNAAFGVPGADGYTGADWTAVTGGEVNTTFVDSDDVGSVPVAVTTADELAEVFDGSELSANVILTDMPLFSNYTATESYTINGNGLTATMVASDVQTFDWTENGTIPLMANVFSSENGAPVTVNDLTMTGTMQSVMAGNYETSNQGRHNTVFNNVNIVNAEVVSLSAGISPALSVYGTLEMNNCNVYGATLSPMDTDPMWPVYDMAVVNFSNTTINGGKVGSIYTWQKAALEINNAEVDSIISACRVTNDFQNGGLVIGSGTTVGEITVTNVKGVVTIESGAVVNQLDLSAVTTKDGIVIEDGATVNAITVNGEVVDYATWKNS